MLVFKWLLFHWNKDKANRFLNLEYWRIKHFNAWTLEPFKAHDVPYEKLPEMYFQEPQKFLQANLKLLFFQVFHNHCIWFFTYVYLFSSLVWIDNAVCICLGGWVFVYLKVNILLSSNCTFAIMIHASGTLSLPTLPCASIFERKRLGL